MGTFSDWKSCHVDLNDNRNYKTAHTHVLTSRGSAKIIALHNGTEWE